MGRKAHFKEGVLVKKGPGKKAKKQKDPVFPKALAETENSDKKLSVRQKRRLKKREQKRQEILDKVGKGKKNKEKNPPGQFVKKLTSESDESDEFAKEEEVKKSKGKHIKGYSDDNKNWLKPKNNNTRKKQYQNGVSNNMNEEDNVKVGTLDDLSDDTDQKDEFDSDSENDDENGKSDDDLLPIEKQNKILHKQQIKEQKLADEELKLNIANQEHFQFPTKESEEQLQTLQDCQQRIREMIAVLSDFKRLRDKEHSRSQYIDLLRKDLCMYYSYNEFLMEKLMQLFPLSELLEFLEASEVQRPLTIRTNSLKTRRRDLAQALINRGVNLDPVGKWSKIGLVVYTSQVPMGATPEYLAGHYIIQGASSLLPVMALAPQEGEKVLDMAAAPGGKASHIAAVMKNTGVLFANDSNKDRITAVVGNFHRLGVVNSAITCMDGRKYPDFMKVFFDRVLLDAPCTGTGVVAKDPSVKTSKDDQDVQRCYNLQRQLLLAAIDCINAKSNTGGYIVYSTCSILPEENEWVVDFALKKRNVKLVDTGLGFGTNGFTKYRNLRFHPTMSHTRRFYPHEHNMDGFFVAKLKKFSNVIPKTQNADGNEDAEEGFELEPLEDSSKRKAEDDGDHFVKQPANKRTHRKDKDNVKINAVETKKEGKANRVSKGKYEERKTYRTINKKKESKAEEKDDDRLESTKLSWEDIPKEVGLKINKTLKKQKKLQNFGNFKESKSKNKVKKMKFNKKQH
ncbi:uncharacterized protein LOC132703594 [Cylas formicarius]|uniref:uncharacterized protein LOC132703594 n=1 Tax=Cylas formicarius TaxID=197179 RepID=UPI00295892DB|nr:uncharacterized protein LOC132703594 [Cylas formicarius]